jgi:hypothetical protein
MTTAQMTRLFELAVDNMFQDDGSINTNKTELSKAMAAAVCGPAASAADEALFADVDWGMMGVASKLYNFLTVSATGKDKTAVPSFWINKFMFTDAAAGQSYKAAELAALKASMRAQLPAYFDAAGKVKGKKRKRRVDAAGEGDAGGEHEGQGDVDDDESVEVVAEEEGEGGGGEAAPTVPGDATAAWRRGMPAIAPSPPASLAPTSTLPEIDAATFSIAPYGPGGPSPRKRAKATGDAAPTPTKREVEYAAKKANLQKEFKTFITKAEMAMPPEDVVTMLGNVLRDYAVSCNNTAENINVEMKVALKSLAGSLNSFKLLVPRFHESKLGVVVPPLSSGVIRELEDDVWAEGGAGGRGGATPTHWGGVGDPLLMGAEAFGFTTPVRGGAGNPSTVPFSRSPSTGLSSSAAVAASSSSAAAASSSSAAASYPPPFPGYPPLGLSSAAAVAAPSSSGEAYPPPVPGYPPLGLSSAAAAYRSPSLSSLGRPPSSSGMPLSPLGRLSLAPRAPAAAVAASRTEQVRRHLIAQLGRGK